MARNSRETNIERSEVLPAETTRSTGPRLVVYSRGMMKWQQELAILSGLNVRHGFLSILAGHRSEDVIGGWGHKPTADRARHIAVEKSLKYWAFEDGFLRSVRPGPGSAPLSMIIDKTGIYYDARQPSDLETRLNTRPNPTPEEQKRSEKAIALLQSSQISKYNTSPSFEEGDQSPSEDRKMLILVIDQTYGDASIEGGLTTPTSFNQMLEAACRENPEAEIIVKSHPEVINGTKQGYLTALAKAKNLRLISSDINPWNLLQNVAGVYTVSSQLGFEALMAGCTVTCFGMPFYAGWGLTDDRVECIRRTRKLSLLELVSTIYFEYCRYFDAWRRTETDFFTAVDQLVFLRDHFHNNLTPIIGYRISYWKRLPISRMLCGDPKNISWTHNTGKALSLARENGGRIACWARNKGDFNDEAQTDDLDILSIEDGFLRSVGLGVSFTPSASYVFDAQGIYYDSSQASDIESVLETGGFSDKLLNRAEDLRQQIIESGISKYNLDAPDSEIDLPKGREIILVPGQVADDQSVLLGAKGVYGHVPLSKGGANLGLLEAVRKQNPEAYILYKPHPDVQAGLRKGAIDKDIVKGIADELIENASIHHLLTLVDRVETLTSLTGFEALLRGVPVAVHGQPFYAGWGLSDDLCDFPRRTRELTLTELIAGSLLVYPRYFDRQSNLPCPAEITLESLIKDRRAPRSISDHIRHIGGSGIARARHILSGK